MLRIPLLLFEQMCEHAQRGGEHEVCGVLVGDVGEQIVQQVVAGQNVASEPTRFFTLDAATLLQADQMALAHGWEIVGFYHSHPQQLPFPSARDRAALWPDLPMVIVGAHGQGVVVCAWQADAAQLRPCCIVVEG